MCQLGLQIILLDKRFSPPGKYVEPGLCFISRQPSKANWPEPGEFSSVLIGEAEKGLILIWTLLTAQITQQNP